jgi:hypothetical protein
MGLTLFLLEFGSRRRLRFELDTAEALANLDARSCHEQETVAPLRQPQLFPGRRARGIFAAAAAENGPTPVAHESPWTTTGS